MTTALAPLSSVSWRVLRGSLLWLNRLVSMDLSAMMAARRGLRRRSWIPGLMSTARMTVVVFYVARISLAAVATGFVIVMCTFFGMTLFAFVAAAELTTLAMWIWGKVRN